MTAGCGVVVAKITAPRSPSEFRNYREGEVGIVNITTIETYDVTYIST